MSWRRAKTALMLLAGSMCGSAVMMSIGNLCLKAEKKKIRDTKRDE